MKRVTPAKARTYKRATVYFRNRHGELFPVVTIERKSPNWLLRLEDGREFLIDPSNMLEVDA